MNAKPEAPMTPDTDVEMFDICVLSAMIEVEISKHPRTGDNVPKRATVHKLIREYVAKKLAASNRAREEAVSALKDVRQWLGVDLFECGDVYRSRCAKSLALIDAALAEKSAPVAGKVVESDQLAKWLLVNRHHMLTSDEVAAGLLSSGLLKRALTVEEMAAHVKPLLPNVLIVSDEGKRALASEIAQAIHKAQAGVK